jgi:hypothetical protein
MKGFFMLQQSLILASVHSKDVKHVDCVQQYFPWENNKELTVQCVLMWPALFLLLFLFFTSLLEMLPLD